MSYGIEYRYAALYICGERIPDGIDRYAICVEAGDSNVYDGSGGSARRSRKWQCSLLGTREEILEDACSFAGACEGGGLKPFGRDCTPESYLTRIETLLSKAVSVDVHSAESPRISLRYETEIDSEEDQYLAKIGVARKIEKQRYSNSEIAHYSFSKDNRNDYGLFFMHYRTLNKDRSFGWHFATCSGPL